MSAPISEEAIQKLARARGLSVDDARAAVVEVQRRIASGESVEDMAVLTAEEKALVAKNRFAFAAYFEAFAEGGP